MEIVSTTTGFVFIDIRRLNTTK